MKKNINKVNMGLTLDQVIASRQAKTIKSSILLGLGLDSVQSMTGEDFMNYTAKIAGKFLQESDILSVGSLTIFISTCVQLNFLYKSNPEKMVELFKRVLINSEIMDLVGYNSIEDFKGTADYINVVPLDKTLQEVKVKVQFMSENIMMAMIEQLKTMDFNAENVRDFLMDLNICGRMWQELTIDAAKKLYTVFVPFYQQTIKAMSTVRLTYNLPSFEKIFRTKHQSEDKEVEVAKFEILRKGVSGKALPKQGESHFEYNENGEVTKEFFGDVFSMLQDEQIVRLEDFVNGSLMDVYEKAKLSEAIISDLCLTGILNESNALALDLIPIAIYRYNNAISNVAKATEDIEGNFKLSAYEKATLLTRADAEYRNEIESISNDVRYFTNHLSTVGAGRALMGACYGYFDTTTKGVTVKAYKNSKAFLYVANELGTAYVVDAYSRVYGDNNVAGSPILGKNAKSVVEGDKVDFSLGVALAYEDLYIEDQVSGTLTIKDIDGRLYAVKNMVNAIEENRVGCVAPENIAIQIYKKNEEAITDAISFTLHPLYFTTNVNGKKKANYNVIVASKPSLDDPEEVVEVIAAKYTCYSAHVENIIAGATFEEFVTLSSTERTALLQVPLNNFVDVERNNSVSIEEEDIFGNNADDKMDAFREEKDIAKNTKSVQDDPFAEVVAGNNKPVNKVKATDVEDPFAEAAETSSKLLNEADWSFLAL